MSGTLQKTHRPTTFEEFVGNKSTMESLISVLDRDIEKVPHVFLFTGPSGCGKTTLSRIVVTDLECDPIDYKEINAADLNGVGSARAIIQEASFAPMGDGNVKIYYLDEAHKLTTAAQNALLKILEDTPKHVYFILSTTEEQKLLKTIKTRCHIFRVTPLLKPDMITLIKKVAKKEKYKISNEVLKAIIKSADGSPRQALVILDSIIDIEDEKKALKTIVSSVPQEASIKDFCTVLLSQDAKKFKWKELSRLIKSNTDEPETVRRGIMGYLTAVLLNNGSPQVAEILSCFLDNYYDSGKSGLVLSCYSAVFG